MILLRKAQYKPGFPIFQSNKRLTFWELNEPYFKGSDASPSNTSIKGELTANTMFNLKINIDFTNKNNAKIYMNDTLLDTIDHSNWTKSAYSNRNNFFIMSRNAIATVNTIKIKNI